MRLGGLSQVQDRCTDGSYVERNSHKIMMIQIKAKKRKSPSIKLSFE